MTTVEQFIADWLNFDTKLRSKEGIDYELLEKIETALTKIKEEFQESAVIPKDLAGIFIDMYSALESTSYLYADEQQKEIISVAETFAYLARDICS